MNPILFLLCAITFFSVILAQRLGAHGLAQFLLLIYVVLVIVYFSFSSKFIYKKNKEFFTGLKNGLKQEINTPVKNESKQDSNNPVQNEPARKINDTDKNEVAAPKLSRLFEYGSVKFYAAALTVVIGWAVVIFLFIWIRRHSM